MNYVTLVNKENLIKDKYLKNLKLVNYNTDSGALIQLEEKVLDKYLELKQFLKKKGIYVEIIKAYKNFEKQQNKSEK